MKRQTHAGILGKVNKDRKITLGVYEEITCKLQEVVLNLSMV